MQVKRFIRPLLRCLFYVFRFFVLIADYLIPKSKKKLVFGSSRGEVANGNSLALYNYIRGNSDYHCRFFLRFKCPFRQTSSSYYLSDIWFFLRSRIIIITHGLDDLYPFPISRRKIVINLFHGVPSKGMGMAQKERNQNALKNGLKGIRYNFFLASSKIAAHNINYCLQGHKIVYLLCGQPRNDHFFDLQLKWKVSKREMRYDKIFLYAPTWREFADIMWFPFPNFNIDRLNIILKDKNCCIFLRPHKNDNKSVYSKFIRSNIRLLNFSDHPDVNDFLPYVDCLITDYSSIYNDFLLLNRPIVFLQYDLKEYLEYNSILFDNYEYWYPGTHPKDEDSFVNVLEKIIICGKDGFEIERKRVNSLLHVYEDGNSCSKLLSFIQCGQFNINGRELQL